VYYTHAFFFQFLLHVSVIHIDNYQLEKQRYGRKSVGTVLLVTNTRDDVAQIRNVSLLQSIQAVSGAHPAS